MKREYRVRIVYLITIMSIEMFIPEDGCVKPAHEIPQPYLTELPVYDMGVRVFGERDNLYFDAHDICKALTRLNAHELDMVYDDVCTCVKSEDYDARHDTLTLRGVLHFVICHAEYVSEGIELVDAILRFQRNVFADIRRDKLEYLGRLLSTFRVTLDRLCSDREYCYVVPRKCDSDTGFTCQIILQRQADIHTFCDGTALRCQLAAWPEICAAFKHVTIYSQNLPTPSLTVNMTYDDMYNYLVYTIQSYAQRADLQNSLLLKHLINATARDETETYIALFER